MLFVVEKHPEKNKINDRAKLVRKAAEKRLDVVMRSDCTRDPAQCLISRLRKRFASIELKSGMHRIGKKRHSLFPENYSVFKFLRTSTEHVTDAADHLVGRLKNLDVPIGLRDACTEGHSRLQPKIPGYRSRDDTGFGE